MSRIITTKWIYNQLHQIAEEFNRITPDTVTFTAEEVTDLLMDLARSFDLPDEEEENE